MEQNIPDRANTKFRSLEKHGMFLESKSKCLIRALNVVC